jgi:multiple sugar transport system substrate-binding protein
MNKLISLLFISSIILSSCSAGTPSTAEPSGTQNSSKTPGPEATNAAASKLPVKEEALKGLEITVWTPWYGIESTLFDSFVKDFNSQNEWGIKVTAQSQVNFTNIYETVNTSLPTSEKPDLVIALPEHALEWNEEGVVTDLTPYVQDPKYGLDSKDIPFVFWNQDITAEARVAIPAQRTAQFLLWNETWAQKLGFSAAPTSAADFQKQSCGAHVSKTKDESAQDDFMGGWIVDTGPMTAYAWMLAFDGGVQDGPGYRFLTPNNLDAFKFLRELSETSCAWQVKDTDPLTAFANRDALFITANLEDLPTVAREFASANSTDKWKVIPFPGKNDGAFVVYGSSYVVLKSTDAEQLGAWLFVRWLLENKQDARWVETTHRFPLRTSTLDLLADYKKTHPQWAQAIDLLPQAKLQPQVASWRTIKVMLGDGFDQMYRVNVPSGQVAAILAQMESLARDLTK